MRISEEDILQAIFGDDRPAPNADEFDTCMILNCRDLNPQELVLKKTPNRRIVRFGKGPVHIFATVYTIDGERGFVVGRSSMSRGWLVVLEGETCPEWYHEDEVIAVE